MTISENVVENVIDNVVLRIAEWLPERLYDVGAFESNIITYNCINFWVTPQDTPQDATQER